MSKEVELGVFAKRFTGRVCVVRTFSAGVHMGRVDYIDPQNKKECILVDCTRIWSWDGSLSLSGVAAKGVKSARLQRCPEIDLTEAIEYLPTTEEALQTFKEEYYT